MNSYKSCPAFDLETGERRPNNQNAPRRFKFTGAKSNGPDDSNTPTNGAKMTNNNSNNRLQTQKSNVALLSDEDLGISTSSFKPRFPVVVNETKKSSSSSVSSPSSMSFGSVKTSAVDGLPSARLGRDGKFLGNYSHNFRNDEVRTKKDWWSPK